jgi:lipopolysaccharide biosynthesis glycosyltransferase
MKTAIVTSFDKNYMKVASVLIKSLDEFTTSSTVLDIICLVPDDIVNMEADYVDSLGGLKSVQIKFRSSSRYRSLVNSVDFNFDKVPHITENAMQRLFLASTLHDYDKAIYIDPDAIAVRDIAPILNYPLYNKLVAWIEHNNVESMVFDEPDRAYFNNGVFITDLNYWRSAGIEQKMVDWALENGPTICADQDLMNRFLLDVLAPMPITFNFPEALEFYHGEAYPNPVIVHFVGPKKPWLPNSRGSKWSQLWVKKYSSIYK